MDSLSRSMLFPSADSDSLPAAASCLSLQAEKNWYLGTGDSHSYISTSSAESYSSGGASSGQERSPLLSHSPCRSASTRRSWMRRSTSCEDMSMSDLRRIAQPSPSGHDSFHYKSLRQKKTSLRRCNSLSDLTQISGFAGSVHQNEAQSSHSLYFPGPSWPLPDITAGHSVPALVLSQHRQHLAGGGNDYAQPSRCVTFSTLCVELGESPNMVSEQADDSSTVQCGRSEFFLGSESQQLDLPQREHRDPNSLSKGQQKSSTPGLARTASLSYRDSPPTGQQRSNDLQPCMSRPNSCKEPVVRSVSTPEAESLVVAGNSAFYRSLDEDDLDVEHESCESADAAQCYVIQGAASITSDTPEHSSSRFYAPMPDNGSANEAISAEAAASVGEVSTNDGSDDVEIGEMSEAEPCSSSLSAREGELPTESIPSSSAVDGDLSIEPPISPRPEPQDDSVTQQPLVLNQSDHVESVNDPKNAACAQSKESQSAPVATNDCKVPSCMQVSELMDPEVQEDRAAWVKVAEGSAIECDSKDPSSSLEHARAEHSSHVTESVTLETVSCDQPFVQQTRDAQIDSFSSVSSETSSASIRKLKPEDQESVVTDIHLHEDSSSSTVSHEAQAAPIGVLCRPVEGSVQHDTPFAALSADPSHRLDSCTEVGAFPVDHPCCQQLSGTAPRSSISLPFYTPAIIEQKQRQESEVKALSLGEVSELPHMNGDVKPTLADSSLGFRDDCALRERGTNAPADCSHHRDSSIDSISGSSDSSSKQVCCEDVAASSQSVSTSGPVLRQSPYLACCTGGTAVVLPAASLFLPLPPSVIAVMCFVGGGLAVWTYFRMQQLSHKSKES